MSELHIGNSVLHSDEWPGYIDGRVKDNISGENLVVIDYHGTTIVAYPIDHPEVTAAAWRETP